MVYRVKYKANKAHIRVFTNERGKQIPLCVREVELPIFAADKSEFQQEFDFMTSDAAEEHIKRSGVYRYKTSRGEG